MRDAATPAAFFGSMTVTSDPFPGSDSILIFPSIRFHPLADAEEAETAIHSDRADVPDIETQPVIRNDHLDVVLLLDDADARLPGPAVLDDVLYKLLHQLEDHHLHVLVQGLETPAE